MAGLTKSPADGVLLVGNFSNRTGYAWNNIYRLFGIIAAECRGQGLAPWVSFASFDPPLQWEHADVFAGVLVLHPRPTNLGALARWLSDIRRCNIKYVYLTDQPSWSFRYALLRIAGVRRIIVHNRISVPDPRLAQPDGGVRGAVKWLASRLPFIQATRIYAVSDFVRHRLIRKEKLPKSRVVRIMNGVDLRRFAPVRGRAEQGPVVIFCGGRATIYKGVDVLIHATAMLRDEYKMPSFFVRYAGEGPDAARFRSLVNDLALGDHFQFLGELKSTTEEVANADILVVPSNWGDACPSAVSEALACGKALVSTRAGGIPELIGDQEAAILVEPGDSAALAAGLAELIIDPVKRRELGMRARRRAEEALDQRRYYAEVLGHLGRDLGVLLAGKEYGK